MEHIEENVEGFNKTTTHINNNTRNILISNQIAMCTMILRERSEDINLVIDAINDGKHGIIHRQLWTPRIFLDDLKEFEDSLNTKYPIPLRDTNFEHIVDISEIGFIILSGNPVYSVKIHVLETDQFSIQHLIPIPRKQGINI